MLREKSFQCNTPLRTIFLRYLQCCNALQAFESDSKTCNSIARIWSKLVSATCCRRFLSQRWPEFLCFRPRLPRQKSRSVSLETNSWNKNRPSVTCLQIRAKNMRGESALQIGQCNTTFTLIGDDVIWSWKCHTMPCRTIPYHTIPCHTMPCHAIPYHTIPCHAMPRHAISYHTIPYHAVPYRTVPYHTIPYHTIPYHTIPYHTIPYHTIPYHTIPYHAMPYHTTPHHTMPYRTMPYHTIPLFGSLLGRSFPFSFFVKVWIFRLQKNGKLYILSKL